MEGSLVVTVPSVRATADQFLAVEKGLKYGSVSSVLLLCSDFSFGCCALSKPLPSQQASMGLQSFLGRNPAQDRINFQERCPELVKVVPFLSFSFPLAASFETQDGG